MYKISSSDPQVECALARKNGQIIAGGEGRWLVRVNLGRDEETRRRRYRSSTIRGGLRAAQRYLNHQLEECERSRELEGTCLTPIQYLDRWLELAAQPKLRSKSASDYQAMLCSYIRPALWERELGSFTPLDSQHVYREMYEKGLSKRTVQYVHAVLHAAYAREGLNEIERLQIGMHPAGEEGEAA